MKIYYRKKEEGITIIEVVIVMTLMVLLLGFTAPFGVGFHQEQTKQEGAHKIESDIKRAQSYAQSGKMNSSWGIKLNPTDKECQNCYVFFRLQEEDNYYSRSLEDKEHDQVFSANEETLENFEDVIFEKNTGFKK